MDRKKIVAEEHRFRRGQPAKSLLGGAGAEAEVAMDAGEEQVVYPWEKREAMSYKQVKDLIAKKPHH